MYLRVPWWVMYLFSCLYFLKQTSWLRLADASGLDFQCCFHHDLGPHQHCGSFNDPIHEETALSAGIHHHVTWRCVFDPGHRVLSFFQTCVKASMFQASPKNIQVWHPNHWTQCPGYSLHALWCLLVSLWEWDGGEEWPFNQERRVAHQAVGNLAALSWKPESICIPCELLLILCSFVLGGKMPMIAMFSEKHLQPFANKHSVCLRCAIWTLAQPWIRLPQFILEASKTSSSKPKSHSEIDHPF